MAACFRLYVFNMIKDQKGHYGLCQRVHQASRRKKVEDDLLLAKEREAESATRPESQFLLNTEP